MKKTIFSLILMLSLLSANAQQKNLKIFYDCQTGCYQSFIKQNLSGVEFVREPQYADVHIQITSETNGSGGETFHLEFMGKKTFKDIQRKNSFATNKDMTDELIRQKILKYIKLGLIDFWLKKGMDDMVEIKLNKPAQKQEKDKWNNWIFKLGANVWLNGSSNSKNSDINGYVSVKQVKEAHKFYFKLQYGKNTQEYKFNGNKIVSEKKWVSSDINEILSINSHWSYGFFGSYLSSKYRNYQHRIGIGGGLEYDIFPYKDNAKKSLVFSGILGGRYNKYIEKTVYNKTEELLPVLDLDISGSFVQKWGNVYGSVSYHTFLNDPKLNAFDFGTGVDIRITKGLNFRINGNYSITHNQVNIAGGDLSLEETLLAQKELQSGYDYFFSVGLNYSFGSIYNTIVNPRFDSTQGGGRTCFCF